MDLTEDQTEIRDLVRRTLADQQVGGGDTPTDEAARITWALLSGELGVGGLIVPEEFGGLGLGLTDLAVVLRECGRKASPAPVLSSALATDALRRAEAGVRERWLPRMAEGSVGAVCLASAGDDWFTTDIGVTATPADGGHRLDGTAHFVLDGALAEVLIVLADEAGTPGLYVVDPNDPSVTRTALPGMDTSRAQATITFSGTTAEALDPQDRGEAIRRLRHNAFTLLAAEQLGAAEYALEMAVEYARERHQFGRAIGSFQAIKHQCADMLIDVERMRSVAEHALNCADAESADLSSAASAAQVVCSTSATQVTLAAVQVHGGIGFTWEHDAHRLVRRAKASEAYLGLPSAHTTNLATLLLDD